jgi:hypothetical protein
MSNDRDRIRALNDELRQHLLGGGAVMTPGIAVLGQEAVKRLIQTISLRRASTFIGVAFSTTAMVFLDTSARTARCDCSRPSCELEGHCVVLECSWCRYDTRGTMVREVSGEHSGTGSRGNTGNHRPSLGGRGMAPV